MREELVVARNFLCLLLEGNGQGWLFVGAPGLPVGIFQDHIGDLVFQMAIPLLYGLAQMV